MKVFMVGATGFIGSYVAHHLLDAGHIGSRCLRGRRRRRRPSRTIRMFNAFKGRCTMIQRFDERRPERTCVSNLARLCDAVLNSDAHRETYFGLAETFVTWEAIANEAVRLTGGGSRVVVEGISAQPCMFDLRKIREQFGLSFSSATQLSEHLRYLIETV